MRAPAWVMTVDPQDVDSPQSVAVNPANTRNIFFRYLCGIRSMNIVVMITINE